MPSVLVELGFISNSNDLAALKQENKRDQIAQRLFEAFKDYKEIYDGSLEIQQESQVPPAPVAAVRYGTQIFASSKIIDASDPAFMGYKPEVINIGSLNKYIIGIFESEAEARKANETIKVKYPGSFMVKLTPEGATRFK